MKKIFSCKILLLFMMPFVVSAQVLDTNSVLNELATTIRGWKSISYKYNVEIHFPNGDKDHTSGMLYLNSDDKVCFNDCAAFTMIYTVQWFYKADHRKKELMIVDLDKEGESKQTKKEREKEIFQGVALAEFLDSVVCKKSSISKYSKEGDIIYLSLDFPGSSTVHSADFVYDNKELISYKAIYMQPWQRTPKGIQSIETKISCTDFSTAAIDKSKYVTNVFFEYKNGKLALKKYNDYKLSSKL